MTFSIIIPTYNRKHLTKIAIDSVLKQTFTDYEIIIVDDGSTDNSFQELSDYKSYPRGHTLITNFKLLRHDTKQGVSVARNTGIKNAQGNWICFLDSDDRFRKDKLQKTYDYIQQFPKYKIFHTEEIWYSNNKILGQKKKHKKPDEDVFKESLKSCCVGPSTVCIDKKLLTDYGLFDESLPACEDYDLWLKISSNNLIKLLPYALTIKQGGRSDQLSAQHSLDKYRIIALKNLLQSSLLNNEQSLLAEKELKTKLSIFYKGCVKNKNVGVYEELLKNIPIRIQPKL